MINDYRFKLIYNFSSNKKIKRYYKKLSAFEVLNLQDLKDIATKKFPTKTFSDISDILISAICHPNIVDSL